MYAVYRRLNVPVEASWRGVIRAIWFRKLSRCGRHKRDFRPARKDFYRTMLRYHEAAKLKGTL